MRSGLEGADLSYRQSLFFSTSVQTKKPRYFLYYIKVQGDPTERKSTDCEASRRWKGRIKEEIERNASSFFVSLLPAFPTALAFLLKKRGARNRRGLLCFFRRFSTVNVKLGGSFGPVRYVNV